MSDKQLLKWAGGKTALLDYIIPHLQVKGNGRLLEPFFGSGAIAGGFKQTMPANYIASDINSVLIHVHTYVKIRNTAFINELKAWFSAYRKAPCEGEEKEKDIVPTATRETASETSRATVYYVARKAYNSMIKNTDEDSNIKKAALFIFLNRTCFRGLWRENKEGKMNVPFGHYKADTAEVGDEELEEVAQRLSTVQLVNMDFEKFLLFYKPALGDIIYCDPPYWAPDGEIFASYDKSGFGKKETEKLLQLLLVARQRGAKIVLSNAPSDWLRDWATAANGEYHTISTRRRIRSKGTHDKEANEALVILS